MRPLRHVIEDFFNAMSLTFDVVNHSVTGNPAITSIVIDNILNLRAGLTVKIDGTDYVVLSVTGTTIFTVQANLSNPAIVILPRPIWFAGSPLSVNKKLNGIPVPQFKVPMLWLYEVIREKIIDKPDSAIEREAPIRLFFLDEADFSNWENSTNQADYYTKVIDGMRRLSDYVIGKMYNSMYFGKFDDHQTTSFAKFGVYVDNKGVQNSVFNEQLSGVELTLTLPVRRITSC